MRTLLSISSGGPGRRFVLAICGLLLVSLVGWALPNISHAAFQDSEEAASKIQKPNSVSGEILVRFRTNATPATSTPKLGMQAAMSVEENGGQLAVRVERLNSGPEIVSGLRVARVAPEETERALEALRKRSDVIYAEPNYIRRKEAMPNDIRYGEQWALKNSGQSGGVVGADIKAEQAWNTTTGSRDVVVAVIDEGIDINHEDLRANIWHNPGEIQGNGIDDDGDGYVDDVYGYDFFHNDATVYDGPGTNPDGSTIDAHGTHVAGTIGAAGNNGLGVAGVNWQVSLMSLKFLGPDGGTTADLLKALAYAKMMRDLWVSSGGVKGANIRVTNNSYGGGSYSQAEFDAIQAMSASGILFVAAAGNDAQDNNIVPSFPASYNLPNVISVAATDRFDNLSGFSNRGSRTVQLGAPGSSILSTTPGNNYSVYSGTSMASPHVAGTAALVLAAHPDFTISRLRAALLFGGDPIASLNQTTITGRRLDAAGSLQNAAENDLTPPATIGNLTITSQDERNVTLNWTAPGDDGNGGQASLYEISFVDQATAAKFLLAFKNPQTAGSTESINLNVPYRHAVGSFLIRASDNAGNTSDSSVSVLASPSEAIDPYTVSTSSPTALSTGGIGQNVFYDDYITGGFGLPFNFPFFDKNFSNVFVSSNGALYFGNSPRHDAFSSTQALNGTYMIAGAWSDLDLRRCFRADSDVYRVDPPDGNRVIFRWQGVKFTSPDCPSTPTGQDQVNFEIELRRDGTIQKRYGQNTPFNPVVGIGGGEPEGYVIASHTSESAEIDLTNAATITYTLRRLPKLADLKVTSSVTTNYTPVGQNVTFNLTASNLGPARTAGVVVTNTLPAGAVFVSCSSTQGTCSGPSNGKVQVDIGLLESGGSANIALTLQPTVSSYSPFLNRTTISGPLTDPNQGNNDASSVTQLVFANPNPQTDLIAIGAGGSQSFAIRSDGYGLAWGFNYFGQLGDGSVSDKSLPVRIKAVSSLAQIDGGREHTIGLRSNGTVWTWGRNDKGQLGDGTTVDRKTPAQVPGLSGVTKVSAGGGHSLVLRTDGTVWAWGDNSKGQLGDGTTVNRTSPFRVPGLSNVAAISAGYNHSLAATADGSVWAWGGNESGQLGEPASSGRTTPVRISGVSNIVAVTAGEGYVFANGNNSFTTISFSLALRNDGTVWAWGSNWRGQLGDGTMNDRFVPAQVLGLTDVSAIAAGGFHAIALRHDGTVWAWGGNFSSQLGDTTTTDRPNPVPVVWLTGIQSIAAGVEHSLALRQDGHLFTWGSYNNGQLGFGGTVGSRSYPWEVSAQVPDPLPIGTVSMPRFSPDGGTFSSSQNVVITSATADTRIDAFYVGGNHNLVRLSTGEVYGWGSNSQAQLGLDPGYPMSDPNKTRFKNSVPVAGLDNVAALSLGSTHNLLLKTDGSVWTSGSNGQGELGYQTNSAPRATFTQVPGVSGVTAVAAGGGRSLALKTDGTVWAWGYGPINSDSPTFNIPPVHVNGLTNVIAIACGSASFAIRTDGSLWAWGNNYQGILGDGTETQRPTPVQVVGVSNVTAVASGFSHSVALKSDGTVWVWGSNSFGELGLGDEFSTHLSPVQVPGLTGVTAVAAGGHHTFALKSDGTVWAWGENFHGELGDGTTAQRRSPVAVVGLTGVTAIRAGQQHAVVQKSDGSLFTWGMNDYGQLGDGTTDNQASPIQMSQLTGGVQIRYTTNGADPTEDDPLFSSGASVFLDHSTVLKARAYKDGWTPSAVKTATYSVTSSTSDWQSVALTSGQVEQLKAWTVGGRTFVYVKPQFPDAGYRVVNWGPVGRSSNDFTVDASVEKFTGASIQSVVTTAQIYDLGPLAVGIYNFNFKTSGTLAKTLQFTVSSATPPPNTIDTAREFVKQQYRDFLNREADPAGENFWTDNITKCSDPARRPAGQTEAQCTLRQRETTSGAFFLSPEFQYTGYYVYRMYQGALGRQPKLSEFTPDAQFVGAGIIVNSQLSGAKINQNKADFAQQFVNCTDATKYRCAEFKAIYDGLNNQAYVDKLFLTTGVNASTSDRTALVNGLNGGTETRASVLQKVVDGIVVIAEGNQQFTTSYGQAFYTQESNRAFVQLEYFGYMKRDPDDAGYAFWLGKLNQFGGNFVSAEMVLAFISSPEYRARFGQP